MSRKGTKRRLEKVIVDDEVAKELKMSSVLDTSNLKTEKGIAGNLTRREAEMTNAKLDADAPSGMTRDQFGTLEQKGYLPNAAAKDAFKALLTKGEFNEKDIAESIKSLPNISAMAGGRKHKQRGGKDCDNTDYAILTAMMAVLYWTGGVGTTLSYVVGSAASYLPTVDKIVETMTLCSSYLSALIPAAIAAYKLA